MQQKPYSISYLLLLSMFDSIIVEFLSWIEDILNNKSAHGFLNRQNPFLWYELISHRMDPWKTENNNYDILENKLKH